MVACLLPEAEVKFTLRAWPCPYLALHSGVRSEYRKLNYL